MHKYVYRCSDCGLASESSDVYYGKTKIGLGSCRGCGCVRMKLNKRKTEKGRKLISLVEFTIIVLLIYLLLSNL